MWIICTLGAILLWSLVNISDGYLVERNKKIGHPIGSLVIFSSLFAIVAAGAIFLFVEKSSLVLSFAQIGILILAGFCNLLWIVFYLQALVDEDVSSVAPWFLSVPLFGYILAYFFLGETLSMQQIVGGVIILAGGMVLSVKKHSVSDGGSYHIRWKPIALMTIASLLVALWGVLFKYAAGETGFWAASFWEHVGLAIAGICVLLIVSSFRRGFIVMLRTSGKRILALNTFSEIATIIGNLLANYALLLVPVTMVFLLQSIQPAIVFALGVICTIYAPSILREDISKRTLIHKGVSIGIMMLGAVLLAL